MHGVQSITDLMVRPGLINLDFADVETVMAAMGKAMMGTGEAEGEGRALKAAEMAISNPLIDDYTLKGAKGLLVNITGGKDLKLFEVDEAVNKVRAEVDPEAELIIGAITDTELDGKMRVSIVATSLDGQQPESKSGCCPSNDVATIETLIFPSKSASVIAPIINSASGSTSALTSVSYTHLTLPTTPYV